MLNVLQEFHEDAHKLSKIYHNLEIVYWIDLIWRYLRYGASPNDYIRYEFYKKNGRERNRFITMCRQWKLCHSLNKENGNEKIADDKYVMNKRFASYIKRRCGYTNC